MGPPALRPLLMVSVALFAGATMARYFWPYDFRSAVVDVVAPAVAAGALVTGLGGS